MKFNLQMAQLWIISLGFLFIAMIYLISIPLGEGVDEIDHFQYIQYIKESRQLPIQPTQPGEPTAVWMGHHPPLYYLLNALFLSGQDTSQPLEDTFIRNSHFQWAENDGRNGWNVMVHGPHDQFPGEGLVRAAFVVRFLGVLYSLITIIALFKATAEAFPTNRWLPFFATAVIAYNRYAAQVGRLEVRYDTFAEEFQTILQRYAHRQQEEAAS